MAGSAGAQVVEADYNRVAAELGGVFDFEAFEGLPEPGARIDGVIAGPGLSIGERFEGQTAERWFEDWPQERARPLTLESLTILPGAPGQNHAVAYHAGFGSNALFPVGPEGFERIEGRGEGVTSVRYTQPQVAVGFRVHADYTDPLGVRPGAGYLEIHFFDPDARLLDSVFVNLRDGVVALAYRSLSDPIGGIQIEHFDPGGIALDDILFSEAELLG
ncbi:MAG: hypothetical protein GVY31_07430 [Alphaproteobacteria bacterium]|nr:hypothetical protein [Alphaproteobacteria bacterium]